MNLFANFKRFKFKDTIHNNMQLNLNMFSPMAKRNNDKVLIGMFFFLQIEYSPCRPGQRYHADVNS